MKRNLKVNEHMIHEPNREAQEFFVNLPPSAMKSLKIMEQMQKDKDRMQTRILRNDNKKRSS